MSPTTRNPYLEGDFAPVRDEISTTDLPVTGRLPRELNGRYLRIGPNPVGQVGLDYHWFLGEGMVHGVRLRDGRAEWYRNRFVRGDDGEATNTNTNVMAHAGRILALVEGGGLPVSMTPDLDGMSTWDCQGTLRDGFVAHPKIDAATGELHAVTWNAKSPYLRYLVLDAAGQMIHSTNIPVVDGPLVHDMGLTAKHVVVLDLPVTVSKDAAARAGLAAPESVDRFPLRWNDNHPSRVGVLPRRGNADQIRWFDAPRCFVFHLLNSFDNPDGSITVDVVRYDTVFRDELRAPADGLPVLARWTIDPVRGSVTEQVLTDHSVEFPRVDPALTGLPHRYGWFAGVGEGGLLLSGDVTRFRDRGFETGPLVKVDTMTGNTTTHDYGTGRVTMEPAFVPRPGAQSEDDGWILSVVHDATSDRAELVVLEAADLNAGPIARVHLPRRVPFGFHGNWISDDTLTKA